MSIDFFFFLIIIILVPFFPILSEERLVDKGALFFFLSFGRTEQPGKRLGYLDMPFGTGNNEI